MSLNDKYDFLHQSTMNTINKNISYKELSMNELKRKKNHSTFNKEKNPSF